MSLEDFLFLKKSGRRPSNTCCQCAERLVESKHSSYSKPEKVYNSKLHSKSNVFDTASNVEKHKTKDVSKNKKEKNLHTSISENSNVFFLLTDGTGQCLFATNTKRGKSLIRNQNIIAEAMTYSKHYNTMNVNRSDMPNTESTNSASTLTSESARKISMYDVSTQTTKKFTRKYENCHRLNRNVRANAHREYDDTKFMVQDDKSSEIISGGIISRGFGDFGIGVFSSKTSTMVKSSKEILAKEEQSQTSNNYHENGTLKVEVNYLKNPNLKDNTVLNETPNKPSKQIYTCEESSTESSVCTKGDVIENIPNYLKDQFTKDNYSSYDYSQAKNREQNTAKTYVIASKTATVENNSLPPNININIDGAKDSYNVKIQYSDGTHEKYTINTIINKINKTDLASEKTSQKHAIKTQIADTLTEVNPTTKETNHLRKENLTNLRTYIGNTRVSADITNPPRRQFPGTHCDRVRGDTTQVKDLVERDREIQRMLGIERRYIPKASKSQSSWSSALNKCSCQQLEKMASSSSERIPAVKPTEKNVLKARKYHCHICNKVGHKMRPGVEKSTGEPLDVTIHNRAKQRESKLSTKSKKVNSHCEPCDNKSITVNQLEYKNVKSSIKNNYRRLTNDRLHQTIKTKKFRRLPPLSANVKFVKMTRNVLESSVPELLQQATFYMKSYHIRSRTGIYQTNVATQTISALEKRESTEIGSYDYEHSTNERPTNLQQATCNNLTCNKDCTILTVQGIRSHASYQCNKTRRTPTRRAMQPFGIRNAISSTEFHEYRKRNLNPIFSRSELKGIQNVGHDMPTQAGESPRFPAKTTLKNDISICTLFQCKKKSKSMRSPNLGMSRLSMSIKESNQAFHEDEKPSKMDVQNDQSLLKRMFRFLFRKKWATMNESVGQGANVLTPVAVLTPNNSDDLYYVNTSLGGVDMTSSVYGTSASRFSRHTVLSRAEEKPNKSFIKRIFKIA